MTAYEVTTGWGTSRPFITDAQGSALDLHQVAAELNQLQAECTRLRAERGALLSLCEEGLDLVDRMKLDATRGNANACLGWVQQLRRTVERCRYRAQK